MIDAGCEHEMEFQDYVEEGKKYSVDEAIEIFKDFHRVPEGNVLSAFSDLQNAKQQAENVTVSFAEGKNGRRTCIVMDVENEEERLSRNYVDPFSGNPQPNLN